MIREEVIDLLEFISLNYQNFKFDERLVDNWFNDLQQYDLRDVKENLKSFMADEKYQHEPPKLSLLTRGLIKKHEKVDWTKVETFCQRCHKPLSISEYEDHIDRCSSIDYVIRETKKWFSKELTRKELFAMPEQEFNERYNKLLHYIHDHTQDESEKKIIGFIFNPPSKERVRNFLGVE